MTAPEEPYEPSPVQGVAAAIVITAVAEVIPGQPTQQADEEET